jgi:ATP-dependent exoDNAse (exonuclease V) beta subunit
LVHEALKAWRLPRDDSAAAFDAWVQARARGYGLSDARQLADAGRETRKLLGRFRAHPLYAEMASAEVRQHEVPFSVRVHPVSFPRSGVAGDGSTSGEGPVDGASGRGDESGIIDVLYRREDRWTLVEFKTDRVPHPSQVERLLAIKGYKAQVERYAAAVEELMGERPRCLICWLDVAGAVRVDAV